MSKSLPDSTDSNQVNYAFNVGSVVTSAVSHAKHGNDPTIDHPSTPQIVVDYVIVFSIKLPLTVKEKANQSKDIEAEYQKVMQRLKYAGLRATTRLGGKGRNELLICVKADEEIVRGELERERLTDWLHGVTNKRPDPREKREYSSEPIQPSEKLRVVYAMITSSVRAPSTPTPTSRLTNDLLGAGIIPKSSEFPHVLSIFPPHDPEFNKQWLSKWSSASHVLTIPNEELNQIKNHFGEAIALYFEFLRSYFISLSFPSALGLITWFLKLEFSSIYSTLVLIWSISFVESWRLRERRLAVEWSSLDCRKVEKRRAQFAPDEVSIDPVTGGKVEIFPWWKRWTRILMTLPALFLYAAVLGLVITAIYSTEVFINEVYSGPFKRYLSLLPTVLFAGVVPQIVALWQRTASTLTAWENHVHESAHERSLTLKMFALNAMVSYGGLWLTAYVYIPFGSLIMPHIVHAFRVQVPAEHTKYSGAFSINAERLTNTLFALVTTTQAIGAFTELGLPLLTRWFFNKTAEVSEARARKRSPTSPPASTTEFAKNMEDKAEQIFLERIRREAELPEPSSFVEYAEMATQFGFVVLWSVIWPLAPLMAFINNFFELRGDAFKLTVNQRRPIPTRTDSIGPWLDVLSIITWSGALTNSSLVYLFKPHPSKSQIPASSSLIARTVEKAVGGAYSIPALNTTSLPKNLSQQAISFASSRIHRASDSTDSYLSIRDTLFAAVVVALTAEHVYGFIHIVTRFLLERLLWRDSEAECSIRKGEWELKKTYLEGMGLGSNQIGGGRPQTIDPVVEDVKRSIGGQSTDGEEQFWARGDVGLDEIRRFNKAE